jgi:hypothetical protein
MFIKPFFHLLPGPDDGAPDGAGAGGGAGEQQQSGNTDKGFPADTPVADMTDAQKAAYYLHQNRQTDNKLKAFNGFTPQDVNAMWTQLEENATERLSASDKAVREATAKAVADARAAAEAELRPKYQAAQLKSAAGLVIKDKEQLESFLAITDPGKFAGEDGEIDEEKVVGHLTALLGAPGQQQGGQQQRNWGQQSGGQPPSKPGSAGLAAAGKRFGTPTK